MYFIYILFIGFADSAYKSICHNKAITQALVDDTNLNVTLLILHFSYDSCNAAFSDATETQKLYLTPEEGIARTYQIHYVSTQIRFFSVNFAKVDNGKTLFDTIGIQWEKLEKDHGYKSEDSKYNLYNYYSTAYDNKYVKCNEQLACCITENREATTCDYRQFTAIPKVDSSNSAFINIIVVGFILVFFI